MSARDALFGDDDAADGGVSADVDAVAGFLQLREVQPRLPGFTRVEQAVEAQEARLGSCIRRFARLRQSITFVVRELCDARQAVAEVPLEAQRILPRQGLEKDVGVGAARRSLLPSPPLCLPPIRRRRTLPPEE